MLFVTVYIPVQSVSAAEAQSADSAGVYVFQDAKKESTVTVIKKWKDGRTNDERPVPDITISTESLEDDKRESSVIQLPMKAHGQTYVCLFFINMIK